MKNKCHRIYNTFRLPLTYAMQNSCQMSPTTIEPNPIKPSVAPQLSLLANALEEVEMETF